jgi:hypothetical protein
MKRTKPGNHPVTIAETETRIALKCDGETVAYVAMGKQDSEWAINLVTAINCHDELMDALRKIAAGEGYYGLQAREYKGIAKAAIVSANMVRTAVIKGSAT